uniref:Uncharacterized protein n=1 Tax=Lactuca sativa TaxID=4236 RepID=A0A9R1V4Q9_LACSA|nr:hypothetical protein LSAT_V11C700353680 [Lactuca sativa]
MSASSLFSYIHRRPQPFPSHLPLVHTHLPSTPVGSELNSATGVERPQLELAVVEEEEGADFKTLQNHKSFLLDQNSSLEDEFGTEEDQTAFMKELEIFHKERCLEFKPPRLWRSVIRLGGYE